MDVTGNFGGESIRLRGMALEDTQLDVLNKISSLVEINEKMAKAQGVDTSSANSVLGVFSRKLSDATGDAGKSISGAASKFDKITEILDKGVGKAFSLLNEAVGASVRTIRGMDSNVDDAGFAIRSLSQNFRGAAGDVARFAADSVSQLQDQYRSFRQMGDIGGVLSSQFENLRVTTSSMGLTMDQYAGLMQENFINLRTGGNMAFKSMQNLQKAVNVIRDDDEVGYIFNRLGINANDYAKVILQQTALNRGLNRSLDTYSEGFAKSMQKSVTNAIGLADAFGVQRSQMLDAQRKAQEDVIFSKMFENIDVAGPVKEMMFNMSMAMTGGDVEKAKKLAVSLLTDIPTDVYREAMAAGGGEILSVLKSGAKDIQSGTADMPSVMAKLQPVLQNFEKTYGGTDNLARFFADPNSPLLGAFTMLLDAARKFAGPQGMAAMDDAMKNAANARKDGTKTELDILNDVQKQNIAMAVTAAEANKGLNAFGLTLAHSTQILTKVMTDIASGTVGTLSNDPMIKELISSLNSNISNLVKDASVVGETSKRVTESILKGMKEGTGQPTDTTGGRTTAPAASSASPTTFAGTPLGNMIRVKTGLPGGDQMMPAGAIDSVAGQHNKGGATSPAIKQLLGVLAGSSESPLRVTGINDAFAGRGANSAHNQGLAVDFTITGDPAKKRAEIVNQLSAIYGLSPGRDFKVFDEYNDPFKHTQGGHLHLEFSKEGAAKFQSRYQGLQGAMGPGGNTTSTPSPGASSPATSSTSSSAPATQSPDLAATVSSAISSGANSLNTATNTVVLADSSIIDRLDQMVRTQQSTNTALSDLKNMINQSTFG